MTGDDPTLPWQTYTYTHLRDLRNRRGYTLRQVADMTGCMSFGRVGDIEKGLYEIKLGTLFG